MVEYLDRVDPDQNRPDGVDMLSSQTYNLMSFSHDACILFLIIADIVKKRPRISVDSVATDQHVHLRQLIGQWYVVYRLTEHASLRSDCTDAYVDLELL